MAQAKQICQQSSRYTLHIKKKFWEFLEKIKEYYGELKQNTVHLTLLIFSVIHKDMECGKNIKFEKICNYSRGQRGTGTRPGDVKTLTSVRINWFQWRGAHCVIPKSCFLTEMLIIRYALLNARIENWLRR